MSDPSIEEKRKAAQREACRKYHAKNREKRNAAQRARMREKYAASPEIREKVYAWRRANPESFRKSKRKHYEANVDRYNENARKRYAQNPQATAETNTKSKKWNAANPDKSRAIRHNYRAKKNQAEGKHTESDVQQIMQMQRGRCAYCRKSLRKDRHLDHIIPVSKGGSNWPRNLQFTCPSCNVKKTQLRSARFR